MVQANSQRNVPNRKDLELSKFELHATVMVPVSFRLTVHADDLETACRQAAGEITAHMARFPRDGVPFGGGRAYPYRRSPAWFSRIIEIVRNGHIERSVPFRYSFGSVVHGSKT